MVNSQILKKLAQRGFEASRKQFQNSETRLFLCVLKVRQVCGLNADFLSQSYLRYFFLLSYCFNAFRKTFDNIFRHPMRMGPVDRNPYHAIA